MGSVASGVTIVTVKGKDGQPRGFTASAVTSLSLEPRMLLVCVSERSSTLEVIKEAGSFAVNILAANQQEVAQHGHARDGFGDGGQHCFR